MNNPVSVVVPTYEGEKRIIHLIDALKNQTHTDFELIVVIDGSTDATLKVLESIQTPFKKILKNQPNSGRAASRNAGALTTAGDIIIFYDDDMMPAPASIERHLDFHKKYSGILCGSQFELNSSTNTDIQNYKAYLSNRWLEQYRGGLNRLSYSNLFFTAANSSFKRRDFTQLNGFDESLSDAEDYEIALRALKKKLDVYFDKTNLATHNSNITCGSYIRRQKEYKQALKKVYQIHTDIAPDRTSSVHLIKRIMYKTFSFAWWPALIDSFNIFLILPKIVRYRIYDAIIYARSLR